MIIDMLWLEPVYAVVNIWGGFYNCIEKWPAWLHMNFITAGSWFYRGWPDFTSLWYGWIRWTSFVSIIIITLKQYDSTCTQYILHLLHANIHIHHMQLQVSTCKLNLCTCESELGSIPTRVHQVYKLKHLVAQNYKDIKAFQVQCTCTNITTPILVYTRTHNNGNHDNYIAVYTCTLNSMYVNISWTPIKGSATNLLVLAYPTHCPTLQTPPPFLWPDICLSKLWLLGNYYKVPTSFIACLTVPHTGCTLTCMCPTASHCRQCHSSTLDWLLWVYSGAGWGRGPGTNCVWQCVYI